MGPAGPVSEIWVKFSGGSCHKVNTDGLAKGNPRPAACGGIFRDASGIFLGGFGQFLGHHSSFYAELYAVILAIEFSFAKG